MLRRHRTNAATRSHWARRPHRRHQHRWQRPVHRISDHYQRRITLALIAHAEGGRRRYRIAVLDTEVGLTPGGARAARSRHGFASRGAVLHMGFIANPNATAGTIASPKEIARVPPSGSSAASTLRNDTSSAASSRRRPTRWCAARCRFERDVSFGEQEMLNPLGVICLRFFPGRGYRVVGRAHGELGSRVEVCETSAATSLPRGID